MERLLDLERLGYLAVTIDPEFILTTGRFRSARVELTPKGRVFAESAASVEEPAYH